MRDVAVAGQDPALGDGARAQLEAFLAAVAAQGRSPHLVYSSRSRSLSLAARSFHLAAAEEELPPFRATALPAILPELDAVHQVAGGLRSAPLLRRARSLWVVSTAASYGLGAALSGRPYACWIGTGLEDEWRSRSAELARARRLALALNAPVLRRIERLVLRRATRVYATSQASRRSVARAGRLDEERVDILPLPVDARRFRPEPDERWLDAAAEPVLAFVGRADDPRKNAALLLAAFPVVRSAIPSARLRLIGEPPAEPVGDGIAATGRVADVSAALDGVTLFVLPSRQEGFGIAVAEALAKGIPTVVTPCGGPEELVRRSGGGVVLDDFSPQSLASVVVELLRAPERLAAMREDGRRYVLREHSLDRLVEGVRTALEELERA